MGSESALKEQRESRQFWAITDTGHVKLTTGFQCDGHQWWCPTLGYTLTWGYHLFDTLEAAKRNAIRQMEVKIERCKEVIKEIEATDPEDKQ